MNDAKLQIRRTHDKEVYLDEGRYENPKEIFKMVHAHTSKANALRPGAAVADFGCAAGELLYYLHRKEPAATYHGYDVVPELLEKARANVPSCGFSEGSVLDRDLLSGATLDVAFMIGVHEIFDDFVPALSNLLYWTREGGSVYLFGGFNPYPVDVHVNYRLVDDPVPEHREPGWNQFSKVSFSRYLDQTLGQGRHRFVPFELPFDLAPRADDPARTWTFLDGQGRRLIRNGLALLINLELLEIYR